jgi:hypothetical protein
MSHQNRAKHAPTIAKFRLSRVRVDPDLAEIVIPSADDQGPDDENALRPENDGSFKLRGDGSGEIIVTDSDEDP